MRNARERHRGAYSSRLHLARAIYPRIEVSNRAYIKDACCEMLLWKLIVPRARRTSFYFAEFPLILDVAKWIILVFNKICTVMFAERIFAAPLDIVLKIISRKRSVERVT